MMPLEKVVRVWKACGKLSKAVEIAMSTQNYNSRDRKAQQWAARLMESVRAVLAERPEADQDNVRHTLILLEKPPLERLRRSLTRGGAAAQRK